MNWEITAKKEGFRIRHFHIAGKLIATLVCSTVLNAKGKVHYGLAIVNPKDNAIKERGRQIAYNRWKKSFEFNGQIMGPNEFTSLVSELIGFVCNYGTIDLVTLKYILGGFYKFVVPKVGTDTDKINWYLDGFVVKK